jgi:hypothetical protein
MLPSHLGLRRARHTIAAAIAFGFPLPSLLAATATAAATAAVGAPLPLALIFGLLLSLVVAWAVEAKRQARAFRLAKSRRPPRRPGREGT